MITLGIDTSNYTTSVALYDSETGEMRSMRRLLKVKEGELGLRQSDAVFQHTLALPELLGALFKENGKTPDAVGVSVAPCDFEGSYMPCFMAGKGVADGIGAALHIPVRYFSHQAGHIAAVLWDANRLDLMDKAFLAFHISGGTTDAVLVNPGKNTPFEITKQCGSLDLKAGQAIDRVGLMLGLSFPAGRALDELSLKSEKEFHLRPYIKDGSCSLSGVENQCRRMIERGEKPEDAAKYCIDYITMAIEGMAQNLRRLYPGLGMVFSGGVSSNTLMRRRLQNKFDAVFSLNGFASDNAAGIAYLGDVTRDS